MKNVGKSDAVQVAKDSPAAALAVYDVAQSNVVMVQSSANKIIRNLWDEFAVECKPPEDDHGCVGTLGYCHCPDDCYVTVGSFKAFVQRKNPSAYRSVQPQRQEKFSERWREVLAEVGIHVTVKDQPIIAQKKTTRNNIIKGWRERPSSSPSDPGQLLQAREERVPECVVKARNTWEKQCRPARNATADAASGHFVILRESTDLAVSQMGWKVPVALAQ
eukprot:6634333-Prymnesium_polylepis.1